MVAALGSSGRSNGDKVRVEDGRAFISSCGILAGGDEGTSGGDENIVSGDEAPVGGDGHSPGGLILEAVKH